MNLNVELLRIGILYFIIYSTFSG